MRLRPLAKQFKTLGRGPAVRTFRRRLGPDVDVAAIRAAPSARPGHSGRRRGVGLRLEEFARAPQTGHVSGGSAPRWMYPQTVHTQAWFAPGIVGPFTCPFRESKGTRILAESSLNVSMSADKCGSAFPILFFNLSSRPLHRIFRQQLEVRLGMGRRRGRPPGPPGLRGRSRNSGTAI